MEYPHYVNWIHTIDSFATVKVQWCHYCMCNSELRTVEMYWRIRGLSKVSQDVWKKGKYQRTHFWAYRVEPNWSLVTVAWRQTQLFHHHLANNYTQAGRDLCVSTSLLHAQTLIIFFFALLSLSLALTFFLSFYQAYAAWFLPWVAAPTQVGVIVV